MPTFRLNNFLWIFSPFQYFTRKLIMQLNLTFQSATGQASLEDCKMLGFLPQAHCFSQIWSVRKKLSDFFFTDCTDTAMSCTAIPRLTRKPRYIKIFSLRPTYKWTLLEPITSYHKQRITRFRLTWCSLVCNPIRQWHYGAFWSTQKSAMSNWDVKTHYKR